MISPASDRIGEMLSDTSSAAVPVHAQRLVLLDHLAAADPFENVAELGRAGRAGR